MPQDAFHQGYEAYARGAKRLANPFDYIGGHKMRDAWDRGWRKAQREHERAAWALINAKVILAN